MGLLLIAAFISTLGCTNNDTTTTTDDSAVGSDDAGGVGPDLSPPPLCTPDCSGATPHCNATHHCVACLVDTDCAAGNVCKVLSANVSQCVPGCADDTRCHPGGGASSMSCCGMQCADTNTDLANCGGCGMKCAPTHAQATCAAGKCMAGTCDANWGDCNNDPGDGCESNLHVDAKNCGACGKTCSFPNARAGCADTCYIAACNFGYDDCNDDPKDGCETSVISDRKNCGACGTPCQAAPNAVVACTNGFCGVTGCNTGFLDCDVQGANGCEINGAVDANNCGKCGNVCPQGQICKGGGCTCPMCNIPNASAKCINNQCVFDTCNPGFADCDNNQNNGCEVDLNSDGKNCKGCGQVCPNNTPFCFNGVCSAYVPPVECNQAANTDDATRNVNNANANGSSCDRTNNTWYRFINGTGTKIPTAVPPISHCGTDAPGWMQGLYPNFGDGIVSRKVCYNWAGNTCQWSNNINVINCGNYYVFQLPTPPVCNLRYCGEN